MLQIRSIVLLVALTLTIALRAADPIELPVWLGTPPSSEGKTEKETWEQRGTNGTMDRAVRQVHTPTISVFIPDSANETHVGLLIAPGGGYEHVTIDKEGYDVARWLARHGIAGIVLKYRLPKTPGAEYTVDTALADARQALTVVRTHANGWHLQKIGMIGFSAGGNLTILAGTKLPLAERPDFLAPIYPSVPKELEAGEAKVAPLFIVQASDDPLLNAGGAQRLYTWARDQQAPAELHLFAKGGHGFGLGKPGTPTTAWPGLFLTWLHTVGVIPSAR